MENQAPKPYQYEVNDNTSPNSAMGQLRSKMEKLAKDYSSGKLSVLQFNAMYRHYTEQYDIIEKLLQQNPNTQAWRAAAPQGFTQHLETRYAGRILSCVVLQHGHETPLLAMGKLPSKAARQLHEMLKILWQLKRWRHGMAQKSMGDGIWMLMCMGQYSATIAIFMLQPSTLQTAQIRNLQTDFERANAGMLDQQKVSRQLVFPQRALFQE